MPWHSNDKWTPVLLAGNLPACIQKYSNIKGRTAHMISACSFCPISRYQDRGSLLRWPTSTILLCWYAHCCSAKLFFFSAGHFSALPSTFRLCRAVFLLCQAFSFYSERFFQLCQAVFSYAESFSALPSIFRLCWALFCSAKHFSYMACSTQQSRNIHGRAEKQLSIEEQEAQGPWRSAWSLAS